MFELLEIGSGPELVAKLEGHTSPASNLVWADRHGSIGYKLIGRLPLRRGGCPDLPKPGWTGEFEWDGTVPYEELPETVDPESGFLVTANNRIVGDDYPHHITSEWLDGFRAKRIEQLLGESEEHDIEGFEAMQSDNLSLPGLEAARRLGRLHPAGQREISAIERLRSWDGRLDPDTVAGTIYQAFLLRLAREVARAAIGDRDLCERWLDRADNGFTPHVTSPWRWHSHLMGLWEEGDEELIGRPWDELVLEALAGALDDLEERFGPDPEGWRWGHVHEMEFPHPLGDANPLLRRLLNRRLRAGGAQETVSQIAYDPNDPYNAVWAPSWRMVADPTDPDRSRWQMFTGQSGHPASPHYDDLQADWLEGRTQPMAGEGPWRELELVPPASAETVRTLLHLATCPRRPDPRPHDSPRPSRVQEARRRVCARRSAGRADQNSPSSVIRGAKDQGPRAERLRGYRPDPGNEGAIAERIRTGVRADSRTSRRPPTVKPLGLVAQLRRVRFARCSTIGVVARLLSGIPARPGRDGDRADRRPPIPAAYPACLEAGISARSMRDVESMLRPSRTLPRMRRRASVERSGACRAQRQRDRRSAPSACRRRPTWIDRRVRCRAARRQS